LVKMKLQFSARVDSAVAADAACATIASQVASDKQALQRQQKTNELMVAEIDTWRQANEDALKQAAEDGAMFLLSRAGKGLERKEAVARTELGWLTRYEKQMRNDGVPFAMLHDKVTSAVSKYVNAQVQAAGGKAISAGMDAHDIYENFRIQAGLVARDDREADASINEALSNPTFREFVQRDATGWDLLRSTLNVASSASDLAKISPEYALASLVVDGGYDATKWTLARNRILQQYNLSDTALMAVASLQQQIQRTMRKLQTCRGD
jgi:hypothetical protein